MALAILFFGATRSISGLGVIVIWVLATIDAYDQAKKHNLKYGYTEEPIEADHDEKWWDSYRGDTARLVLGGLLIFVGILVLLATLVARAYIWVFFPIILIVLGIGLYMLNFRRFR